MKFILASGSPRRRDLLNSIGLEFEIVPADIDERVEDGESPEDHVRRLASSKALEVSRRVEQAWVLGADTVVVLDDTILGKPRDRRHAAEMLAVLAGRTHVVYTGYAVVDSEKHDRGVVRHVRSEVRIRNLSPAEIEAYIDTGEPMDKAGAYAIQGIGAALVQEVNGSYTNVVGLPLCEVTLDLASLDVFHVLNSRSPR